MREVAFALSIGGFTFLMTVIWGGSFVEVLRRMGIGKRIRVELTGTSGMRHQSKTGTPTMGGLLILIPVIVITGVMDPTLHERVEAHDAVVELIRKPFVPQDVVDRVRSALDGEGE